MIAFSRWQEGEGDENDWEWQNVPSLGNTEEGSSGMVRNVSKCYGGKVKRCSAKCMCVWHV